MIGGEIARIGLGDRQRGQRAAAELGRELGGALEQARMQVEDIARIGLAAGRLAGQQREFAMGRGVLGQIVDDDERVAAPVAEIFGDGEAGKGRDPLQRRRRPRRRRRRTCSALARRSCCTASITRSTAVARWPTAT